MFLWAFTTRIMFCISSFPGDINTRFCQTNWCTNGSLWHVRQFSSPCATLCILVTILKTKGSFLDYLHPTARQKLINWVHEVAADALFGTTGLHQLSPLKSKGFVQIFLIFLVKGYWKFKMYETYWKRISKCFQLSFFPEAPKVLRNNFLTLQTNSFFCVWITFHRVTHGSYRPW